MQISFDSPGVFFKHPRNLSRSPHHVFRLTNFSRFSRHDQSHEHFFLLLPGSFKHPKVLFRSRNILLGAGSGAATGAAVVFYSDTEPSKVKEIRLRKRCNLSYMYRSCILYYLICVQRLMLDLPKISLGALGVMVLSKLLKTGTNTGDVGLPT